MSAAEIDMLQELAKREQRSAASMARIIYLRGLEQYGEKHQERDCR